ncbi:MAG: PAS domain-containing protein, partial [Rhodobacteraceae bacterium]|nr:PAS domain-containing protein [Paracoccaceae bacterium]
MAIHIERLSGLMESGAARLGPLILLTFLCLIGAVVFRGQVWQMAFASGAATFAVFTAVFFFASVADTYARSKSKAELAAYAKRDHVPTIFGDRDGQVTLANRAATSTFSLTGADTVQRALTPLVSNAPALIRRLNTALQDADQTSEIVSIPQGQMTVHAQKLDRDTKIWRFEMPRLDADSDEVEGSTLPSFMVSKSGVILFMNRAARFLIGKRVASMRDVFPACSVTGGTICDVQTAKGPASYLLAELPAGGGRRMVYLLPPPEVEMAQWPTFHELPVALLKLAQDGRVIAHNDAAMSLLGDPLSDAVNVSSLLEGLGRPVEDWLGEVHAGRAIQQSEFLRLKRAEREAFVQVAFSRVEEGGKAFVLAVVTDATELKTMEAQFVQSQKMQAIGQLAGGIAHDFNNLLTAISGHCDLLLVRHDPADSDYADLQQITQNTNRAASLVSQLLAFSRKQTLRPEPLDLRDTLADLTHLLNRLVGEKVMLSLAQDPDLGNIRADKRQLEQVLMNLVVNARDAMPSGGQIRIETEALTLSKPLERDKVTVPSGDYISLRVTDEGTGIQSDKLDKIFEPFYTTKRTGEGTGLGLSMVYGIVKQSGGYVFVDSQVGS